MFPPFHWWRAVFFLIPLISVYTIVLGTLSLGSSLVSRSGRFAHWCARMWAWLILATTGVRVRVTGGHHLDRKTPYLFVSNHQSIYDIPILFASLPFQLRILAKESLGRVPFLGWHLRRTGHVLVNRQNPGAALLKHLADLMAAGSSLIVFPEGTRSVDGRVARFKRGIFQLAIQAGLPVVPLAVSGSRHVMRKGRLMTCPGDVQLAIQPPIQTAGMRPEQATELANRAQSIVDATVRAIDSPEDRGAGP